MRTINKMKNIYIDILFFFKSTFRSIKNLYRWFPIIWKDRDWDDYYIFEILKFKLQNTAHYTESRKWFVGHEHEAARIRLCIKLIERIQDEYYTMEYMDYETSILKFVPRSEDHPGSYELEIEITEDKLDEYFAKYPKTYKRATEQIPDDTENRKRIVLRMGHMQHEKAKRLLFNILNKHIESWWE